MRNFSIRCLFIVCLGWTQAAVLIAQTDNAQLYNNSAPEVALKKFLQDYVKQRNSDDDKDTRFAYFFTDLNDDGKKEAIVYLVGRWWCGSGGCPTLILRAEGASFRRVASILATRPPIRVLEETSHGWHNLGAWVEGGGMYMPYEEEIRFNGTTYPISPPNPPLRRKVKGTIVIPDMDAAIPLYP